MNQEYLWCVGRAPVLASSDFDHPLVQTWIMQEVTGDSCWFNQDSICLPVTSSVTKAYANEVFLFIIPRFGQCIMMASGSVLARAQNPSDKEEFSNLFISSQMTDGLTQKEKPAVGWMALGLHVPSALKGEESFSMWKRISESCGASWADLLVQLWNTLLCSGNPHAWSCIFIFPGSMTTWHTGTGYPWRSSKNLNSLQAFCNIKADGAHDP